uniref:Uncharacterized protein n=1 Tax=Elaeophora elaphi TaxID=1147741 RepID=A0A0R3S4V0_9BILA
MQLITDANNPSLSIHNRIIEWRSVTAITIIIKIQNIPQKNLIMKRDLWKRDHTFTLIVAIYERYFELSTALQCKGRIERLLMSKIEGNSGRNISAEEGVDNTFTSGESIDHDDNRLGKHGGTLPINSRTSQMQTGRKKLAERELQILNGNKDGFTRVIHFHQSVHTTRTICSID